MAVRAEVCLLIVKCRDGGTLTTLLTICKRLRTVICYDTGRFLWYSPFLGSRR